MSALCLLFWVKARTRNCRIEVQGRKTKGQDLQCGGLGKLCGKAAGKQGRSQAREQTKPESCWEGQLSSSRPVSLSRVLNWQCCPPFSLWESGSVGSKSFLDRSQSFHFDSFGTECVVCWVAVPCISALVPKAEKGIWFLQGHRLGRSDQNTSLPPGSDVHCLRMLRGCMSFVGKFHTPW